MVDEQIKRGLDNFASANLRVGFLLDDHPGASYEFDEMTGEELVEYDQSVAKRYASWNFVVCLLTIPGGKTHVGWKDIPTRVQRKKQNGGTEWVDWQDNPENYVSLQTKALGRALKRAGYPDNMGELRALVLWRHRNAALRGADGPVAELERAFDEIPDNGIVDEADVLDVESEEVATPRAVDPPAQQQGLRDAPVDTTTSAPTDNLDVLIAADDAFRALYEPTSAAVKVAMREWITQRGKTSRTAALAWLRHLIELEVKTGGGQVTDEESARTGKPKEQIAEERLQEPAEEKHPATKKVEELLDKSDEERRALGDALREKLREWEETDPKRYEDAMAKLVAAEIWVDEADLSEEDVDRASRILFHGEEV